WEDLDYKNSEEYRIFPAAAHLRRLNLILDSAATAATQAVRDERRDAAHRALSAWLRLDPHSNQNWFETIGVPQLVGRAALEFENELTSEEKTTVLALLRRCVREDGELIYSHQPATGQNLQWQAGLQIIGGYLERDPARVERYVRRIEQEIRITEEEGIQADFSFHQHGPQLYGGGYGLGFTTDAARLAAQTRGTRFALTDASVQLIIRFLLDGQQGMLRGRNWDFTVIGREIGRQNRDALALATASDQLSMFGGSRADELKALARRVRGDDPVNTTPARFRVFWRSDFVSQTRPEFHFSTRMTSTRMNGSEAGNGENERGAYLGDGATVIVRTGDEYRGIFPLWDWRRIPGVTNAYQPEVPLPIYEWSKGYVAGSDFAGGAGDEENGLAAMILDRVGVHAQKSWFFIGESVLCLGADIRATDPKAALITTLNQCWAKSALVEIPNGVQHDGLAYVNLGKGKLHTQIARQTGSWRDVDRLQGATGEVSGDVFTAWLDHDTTGGKPATYAYIVAAGAVPKDLPRVLANTETLQAVSSTDGSLIQIVFWTPGEATLPNGEKIQADAPCLLQLRKHTSHEWTLTAGNPTQKVQKLQVKFNAIYSGDRARLEGENTVITFSFSADPATAGQPQTCSLKKVP
ncbi:MAG: hypothetical protein H7Y43_07300, partial [Akkermansiaceae bacterium]|nr:hypothetical protein [Verrucomicrobiales bacterium]